MRGAVPSFMLGPSPENHGYSLMHFRCSCEVVGLAGYLKGANELEFRFNTPRSIIVRLSTNYPDELKPKDPSALVCTSTTTADAPIGEITSQLKAAISTADGRWANRKGVAPSTLAFFDSVTGELQRVMASTVAVLRWREGLAEAPPDPCFNRREFLSEDGEAWREISTVRSLEIRFGMPTGPATPANELVKEVVELITAGMEEPLGHQLFREAWNQRDSRPRSALVIGVAAAEVGFKKLVASLVPQAQWLVDEVQTPSLVKMLNKFLPTLPLKARVRGKSIRPPRQLLRSLEEAVKCRNDLVHAGKAPPSRKDLDNMLRAVNDLLWICDLYGGQLWALKHISVSTQQAWEDDKTISKNMNDAAKAEA